MFKKLFSFLVISFLVFKCLAQSEFSCKLSPSTRLFLADQQNKNKPFSRNYITKRDGLGNEYLSAIVKVNPSIRLSEVESLGVKIGTQLTDIWTVSIPTNQINRFLSLKGLEYVEMDEPLTNDMDAARTVTRTDSVHQGAAPLPMPYTGKNVVVGIIDAGFDYNHPTFRDTLGNLWRIKKVWEQKAIGTAPMGFSFGHEISDSTFMKTAGTDLPKFSHGTHVAGIAGGSGFGSASNRQFRGIAFESDLVLVGITPSSEQWTGTGMSDVIDGMNYIYTYAASVGKPAVANLSWGCTIGPHDGTSLFSQACDALTGKGKIFVCSGGNNGANNIHLSKTFTSTDTLVNTELTVSSSVNKTWLDIWGDTAEKFCVKITLYNGAIAGNNSGYVCLDNTLRSFSIVGTDGDTCFVDFVPDSATFNKKPRMFLRVYQKSKNTIYVSVKANDAKIDMWTGFVEKTSGYYGSFNASGIIPNTTAGNTDLTTGDIADTKSAIAVASFASKVNFTNLLGNSINYSSYVGLGRRAPYSSKGPSADGRTKPDIAGPGLMIGSGVSSFDSSYMPAGDNYSHSVAVYKSPLDGKEYFYGMLTGTSMSSPVAAGIVGLMLEANPNLTPQKVLDILKNTALHDFYTGPATATGSNLWGYGKVNAFAAVNKAIEALGISSAAGIQNIDCRLFPNPNTGIFTIEYQSRQTEIVQLEVLDITGKQLWHQTWSVEPGSNQKMFDLSHLPKGLHFTKLKAASQGNITFKTLIW